MLRSDGSRDKLSPVGASSAGDKPAPIFTHQSGSWFTSDMHSQIADKLKSAPHPLATRAPSPLKSRGEGLIYATFVGASTAFDKPAPIFTHQSGSWFTSDKNSQITDKLKSAPHPLAARAPSPLKSRGEGLIYARSFKSNLRNGVVLKPLE